MSLKSIAHSWISKIGEYYNGDIYDQKKIPFFWFLGKFLSRVGLSDEDTNLLKDLSKRGTIVYTLKNKSQLNCLILKNLTQRKGLRGPEYCHGINMILWQPLTAAAKTMLSCFLYNPYKTEYLKKLTKKNESSIIYVRGSAHIGSRYPKDPLLQLIDAQREMDGPVFLVPQLVSYGRRREKKKKNILELLFGEAENPGMIRRTVSFFRNSKKAFVISCTPINLKEFLKENANKSSNTVSYLLRREIIERIDREKRSIVGPLLKSREEIMGTVLRDSGLVDFMTQYAVEEGKDYQEVVREASKYLYEIAADYRDSYIGFLDRLLTWVWNNIYDGIIIDKEGLAKIREISKRMPFVVVPCHRSHIDYLLIHYIFYYNNIQLPFIAAGTNLLIWPLGHIFRRSGAFFLRRSFVGNMLYGTVFAKYIEVLIREGLPIEFFIEGGRSRTGKMVMPRYGLLSMVIQAYREGACKNLAIIPVYIGYDRVIEEKSYLQELGGKKKQKEKTSSLMKTGSILKKRYGRVYLNVGEPIEVEEYLANCGTPIEERTVSERQSLYRKMGYEIARRINDVSVVTPFALVASGLLGHYRRGISQDDLIAVLNEFTVYLAYKKIRLSSTFAQMERSILEVLTIFESSGYISKMGFDAEEEEESAEIIYSVEEEKRLNLEYYKNNILHYFMPIAFVSTSILSRDQNSMPLSRIFDDYRFFKTLFWNEFIFDDDVDDAEEIRKTLLFMRERGLISYYEKNGDITSLEIKGRGMLNLKYYSGLIQNYIESYWITIRGIMYLKNKSRPERDLIRKIHKTGIKMYKKGEISRSEALSQPNYKGALRYLQDSGIIAISNSSSDADRKKNEKHFSLTGQKNQMEQMRRTLFKFIALH
ncbi:MAG: 1-acyl-sn-glycerol-3-phosphate acyltransferase [Syntrophales bacterium]|jgi:glycerol-3-phosphate O-acyltransferase|nr:1-acyl-sn-glycerol-3-phosphate acyltransferase [Syntrophales bacterium]MDY0044185.1 1-acyl-sn-glycerol-3-phosphate acyltransferase [Syntrophales bacterium]